MALVTLLSVGAAALLHLCLEGVTDATQQLVADSALVLAEQRPVIVVELLDHLEAPPAIEHVPPHQLRLQPLRDRGVAGVAQIRGGLAQQQVGVPHQLVERVQMPTRSLDELQRFRDLADRLDGFFADTAGPSSLVGAGFG